MNIAAQDTEKITGSPSTLVDVVVRNGHSSGKQSPIEKDLLTRTMGKFYTPTLIVEDLVDRLVRQITFKRLSSMRIVDPFCGDGRLITAFVRRAHQLGVGMSVRWEIGLWDCDRAALNVAKDRVNSVAKECGIQYSLDCRLQDSLLFSRASYGLYDCVVANPPWEMLKPDRRELARVSHDEQQRYVRALKEYDSRLAGELPLSQPKLKFSGWGTNLSRCGTEVVLRLTRENGVCGLVAPSALMTDQMSTALRRWLWSDFTLLEVSHYPAEARLFEGVDQPCISLLARHTTSAFQQPMMTQFNRDSRITSRERLELSSEDLGMVDYRLPLDIGGILFTKLKEWKSLKTLKEMEDKRSGSLWTGRELDETGYTKYLASSGRVKFIKGRMIGRYKIIEQPEKYVCEDLKVVPPSVTFARVAWRDVSRRSQARRMQAAIIPAGIATGNSLHVAFFRDGCRERLRALVAVMNSIPFEFQVRAMLGTGHISLGVVRQVKVPDLNDQGLAKRLSNMVERLEAGDEAVEIDIEVAVAQSYGLSRDGLGALLRKFDGLSEQDRTRLLGHPSWQTRAVTLSGVALRGPDAHSPSSQGIPNHCSANLSELDLDIASAVPPGGNWKDIPVTVRSERLEGIRKSYLAGEGSRSTYYGRLRADKPSYTINTYFSRPGNGCHLHYDYAGGQHRVLSQREAARLQSFPDNFVFFGSKDSVNKQIGNAVPPLLAFQIAGRLPRVGLFVDLFCGAGGLSLGFKWAGWEPIVANDIEGPFLETYRFNIHQSAIKGDIRQKDVFDAVVRQVKSARLRRKGMPLFVLGGPPCQGFSTAGNRRSMRDERNKLFYEYKKMLLALKPDGFLFENVPGLLNMQGGEVFRMIQKELSSCTETLISWKLNAEEYGIPQRRTRVFLVGCNTNQLSVTSPQSVTQLYQEDVLFEELPRAISVEEALSDLPALEPGENGSQKCYLSVPTNPYQAFVRGHISADKYLEQLTTKSSMVL